jgi:chaperonin GroEL (HSP60 family)
MNLQSTNFSGLLKQSTKHTLKVNALLQRLIDVTKFADGHSKLIIDRFERIHLSELPTKIFSDINMTHPIVKLLVEDVARIGKTGDDASYYVKLVGGLLNIAVDFIDAGVDAKKLARMLSELKNELQECLQ